MATFFVRISGSDSNAGTSAGAAWRTIGKALGASGIASGDTVYIGAGTYRETVSVAMTSATVETFVIGDVDGKQTGDAGEVIWSAFTAGDFAGASATQNLKPAGRDHLTFQYITFIGCTATTNASVVDAISTTGATDIKFQDCVFLPGQGAAVQMPPIGFTAVFGAAANWTFDRCRFVTANASAISLTLPTGVGSDYDVNWQVTNCLFLGNTGTTGAGVLVSSSGTSANEGGGVDVDGCTAIGPALFATSTTRVGGAAFSTPCTVKNSFCLTSSSALNSSEAGNLVDNGGNRFVTTTTVTTNVTLHATSRSGSFPAALFSVGQEYALGQWLRPLFSPYAVNQSFSGLLGFGNQSGQATDIFNRSKPEGCAVRGDTGTASSGATTSITDSGKTWGTDQWKGWLVRTTGGTGSGQVKRISSNTGTVLTISGAAPAGGLWATTPDNTTTYLIYQGPQVETGKSTAAGTTTTLTDGGANWATNQWAGYSLSFTGGTGSGQTATVSSNTATVLTFNTQTTAPDSTTTYSLFYPGGSLTATQPATGAMEWHESAEKETGTTDAGGVGIRIVGPGSHEFAIPVDAVSQTISVKARYDADHGTTNKPQATLLANGEIGVVTETKTMTSAADTWETLTFSAFTPTASGDVWVRLVARSDKPYGRAFFDTFST